MFMTGLGYSPEYVEISEATLICLKAVQSSTKCIAKLWAFIMKLNLLNAKLPAS